MITITTTDNHDLDMQILSYAQAGARILGFDQLLVSPLILHITLESSQYLTDVDDEFCYGMCTEQVDGEILIQIAIDEADPLLTLAHELVHVRQSLRWDYEFCEAEAEALEGPIAEAIAAYCTQDDYRRGDV